MCLVKTTFSNPILVLAMGQVKAQALVTKAALTPTVLPWGGATHLKTHSVIPSSHRHTHLVS